MFLLFQVQVLVGRDKGKHGIVSRIVKERNWVFVEGLHLVIYSYFKMQGS